MLHISDVMSRKIVTVLGDDDLLTVQSLFTQHGFHHLMVTEDGKLVGVISDRDLLRHISPFVGRMSERSQDARTLKRRVREIMTRQLVTVVADSLVSDAVRLMLHEGVSCLPVVSFDGRLVGIATWRDLLRAVDETMPGPGTGSRGWPRAGS